ncbi:hypothetical protein PC114_g21552 [Phytophthora cactorum]|nr:hypothetical protein PC114_g21552 [Phytophthora cactorum]
MDWHVAWHDVYGDRFREKWEAEQDEGDFNLDELHDALDDIALIDE